MRRFGLLLLLAALRVGAVKLPKLLGSFPLARAGFTTLYNRTQPGGRPVYHLLVSAFDAVPFSSDYVYMVKDVGSRLANLSAIRALEVTSQTTWPNEVSGLPESVLGAPGVVIPGGFLLPSKTHGAVELVDVSSATFDPPHVITDRGTDWFFHRVLWYDMNQDGRLDAITCRAKKPFFGQAQGQLVWLESPVSRNASTAWPVHVLAEGPDVFFRLAKLNTTSGSRLVIVTAGFFSQSLSLYWTESGSWADSQQVKSRIVDSTIGGVFEVEVVDLNQDGDLDLLVTTNSATNGSVYAYVIPSDFRTGTFSRHLLASGFRPRDSGPGKGAPGAATALHPPASGGKPSILLSGDDDGRAYVIWPASVQVSNWTYVTSVFHDSGSGTIGQLSHADLDGDGATEIFVPDYNGGRIAVYSLQ